MLIIAVMAAHAFGEGSGVGVSFSGERGWAQVCEACCFANRPLGSNSSEQQNYIILSNRITSGFPNLQIQGLLVTIAIGVHNIPEGMAVAGVMMSKGSTPSRALYWTLICSFPQVTGIMDTLSHALQSIICDS